MAKKKKNSKKTTTSKGFTLVELLAVIIILAVIVGITIPVILTTVNTTKQKALETAAQEAAQWFDKQYEVATKQLNEVGLATLDEKFISVCDEDGQKCTPEEVEWVDAEDAIEAAGLRTNDIDLFQVYINSETGRSCVRILPALNGNYANGLENLAPVATTDCDKELPNEQVINSVKVGDYISYTPTKTGYSIPAASTGYSSSQTINPSELNLWRVFKINANGTVEIISQNVSSKMVYFKSTSSKRCQTTSSYGTCLQYYSYYSCINYPSAASYAETLNTIARQYINDDVAIDARHVGYIGQELASYSCTYPVTRQNCNQYGCSVFTTSSCSYGKTGVTSQYKDSTAIRTATGSLLATTPAGTAADYWIAAGRRYTYSNTSSHYSYSYNQYLYIDSSGSAKQFDITTTSSNGGSCSGASAAKAIRPIVTLKAGLKYRGSGADADNPKTIG